MRARVFIAIATLFAWLTVMTAAPVQAHACCKGDAPHEDMAPMPCCIVQPFTASAGYHPGPLLAPDLSLPPVDTVTAILEALRAEPPASRAMLASRHVPDQSGLYLELRVLLN